MESTYNFWTLALVHFIHGEGPGVLDGNLVNFFVGEDLALALALLGCHALDLVLRALNGLVRLFPGGGVVQLNIVE